MKKIITILSLIAVSVFSFSFFACGNKEDSEEMKLPDFDKGVNVTIPEWSVNPIGNENIPALVLDASASNMNSALKEAVAEPLGEAEPFNMIFMFFEGFTDELIASAEEKYSSTAYGELLVNDLPVKLTFTAAALDDNVVVSNDVSDIAESVTGYYLTDACIKKGSYVTTGSIKNDVFRHFKYVQPSTATEDKLVVDILVSAPRPAFILAKETESGMAAIETSTTNASYTNEFYKGSIKVVNSFNEAVECFENDEVLIPGIPGDDKHVDKNETPKGVFTIYPNNTAVYPSPVRSLAYALAYTETKASDGFFVVFYDEAEGEDKEKELKNFDEAVCAASKYVLENPDTVLVVTSAALDGTSQIPAYILGNVPEAAKQKTSLLEFVKSVIHR